MKWLVKNEVPDGLTLTEILCLGLLMVGLFAILLTPGRS